MGKGLGCDECCLHLQVTKFWEISTAFSWQISQGFQKSSSSLPINPNHTSPGEFRHVVLECMTYYDERRWKASSGRFKNPKQSAKGDKLEKIKAWNDDNNSPFAKLNMLKVLIICLRTRLDLQKARFTDYEIGYLELKDKKIDNYVRKSKRANSGILV